MESFSVSTFFATFFDALTLFTKGNWWRFKSLIVCFFCVLIFQIPEYQRLYKIVIAHTERQPITETIIRQFAHPLTNLTTAAETNLHEAKLAFRVTVPFIAYTLHLNFIGVLVMQALVGLIMIWALLTIIERITQDRIIAILLAVGVSFTYYGGAFLHDLLGCLDTFGYAALVLMILSRKPLIIFILTIVGGFVDERVLLASLLVVLWHSMRSCEAEVPQVRVPAITWAVAAVPAGWLAYGVIRYYLAVTYNLKTYTGGVGFEPVYRNLQDGRVALGFITGLESFWMLLFLAVLVLFQQRYWFIGFAFLLAMMPSICGSFLVYDLTRSLSYAFPAVLVALVILNHFFVRNSLRNIAFTTTAFAILIPNYYFHGWILYSESLFEKTARYMVLHWAI